MIETIKWLVYLLILLSVAGCCVFFYLVRGSLYPFCLAFVIAYLLHPFTRTLQARGMNRLGAILSVYLLALGVLVFFCLRIIPPIITDLRDLSQQFPDLAVRSDQLLSQIGQNYQSLSLPGMVRQEIDENLFAVQNDLNDLLGSLAGMAIQLVRYSVGILISPILAFYLLYDWDKMKDEFVLLIPKSGRRQVVTLIKDLDDVLGGVVRGQLIVAILVGTFVTLGLVYLNVPYALLIGLVAGVFDVIPYFGAILGAAPAVIVALLASPALAVKVGILFFIIHQLEGMIIGPKILGDNIGLHPLIVIFCLLAGGDLFGIVGLLFAVPVVAVLKVCLRHFIAVIV